MAAMIAAEQFNLMCANGLRKVWNVDRCEDEYWVDAFAGVKETPDWFTESELLLALTSGHPEPAWWRPCGRHPEPTQSHVLIPEESQAQEEPGETQLEEPDWTVEEPGESSEPSSSNKKPRTE